MKNSQWSLVRAGVVLGGTFLMSCFGGGFLLGQPCSSDGDCGSLSCRDGYCDGGPCVPSPCLNGGTCSEEDGVAVCECPEGYVGELCEPPSVCGDGLVGAGEECDDGNDNNTDECTSMCEVATCGDSFVWEGVEECDDGDDNDNGDSCVQGCVVATCGDSFVWAGSEECDDGNDDGTDECTNECKPAKCGDGFRRAGVEECDDGDANGDDDAVCTVICTYVECGDGYTWALYEECDDEGESVMCNDDCSFTTCGDGKLNITAGEDCDGTDLNGATCEGLGYSETGLQCADGCVLDGLGCGPAFGMVEVSGGVFEMGSSLYTDEQPIRQVQVDTFWMDETEVTVAAYLLCEMAGTCTAPSTGGDCNWMVAGRENHPVNCVDWFQAEAYCGWVQGGTKRLPTEAEWEKAARGTDARVYPWGDSPAPTCDYAVMDDAAAGGLGCGISSTWAVGSKPMGDSPYGAHNMAGNVWEWVADWSGPYEAEETDNPEGPMTGTSRVLRGGSWNNSNTNVFRAAFRLTYNPTLEYNFVGFRCARTPPGAL